MMIQCFTSLPSLRVPHHHNLQFSPHVSATYPSKSSKRRELLTFSATSGALFIWTLPNDSCWSKPVIPEFSELRDSAGVKALDLRVGTGDVPVVGDQVAIHYYGRLAAKQGWRFDSTYDHKDETGEPIPFIFILGSGKVIAGIETAVRSMKVGGIRRVIIPPSQGYQNTSQEPLPPNVADRMQGIHMSSCLLNSRL
ncbi:peptidyl-prolyl cis-trans isomerase FKBP17-1, chloroplastic isoform X2 [Cornus florida]|uniref:peptidyl-prolyl cis-trans isomerase FKBP17-1, chloroplastic isoform X2 n=1 Tax=Cornus florida TaxID=4283 RepID=UPI0028991664|nr:peptidyl-prolyl cis-trans isomerase FKBP17-1, chloroplastic isoform X2 [Cornus florida]